jgi:predicted dehydrogenase
MTLRAGFVGAGRMADLHARCLADVDGCEVAGFVDVDAGRAAAARETHGAAFADTTLEPHLHELDAVWVTTPPFAHREPAETALAADVAVYLEKPLAVAPADARAIADAAAASDAPSTVGYHYREESVVRTLRDLRAAGRLGEPLSFAGTWWGWIGPLTWWKDAARSGGQTVEQATHLYDLARTILGEAERVSAVADTLAYADDPEMTGEDVASASVRFERGVGSFTTTCAAHDYTVRAELLYEDATVRIPSFKRLEVHYEEDPVETYEFDDEGDYLHPPNPAYRRLDRRFVEAVRDGDEGPVPPADALRTYELTRAVLRAAETGESVVPGADRGDGDGDGGGTDGTGGDGGGTDGTGGDGGTEEGADA